jgi:hypothetical protein
MPDSSDLASVIAGTDPLSPQILDALHAEQARAYVANPANWQNTGIAGALGRTLAAFLVPNNTGTVANIAAQRVAAQPDEAKLLAAPDAYSTLAANPDQYSPLARAMVLNGANPESVARARLLGAQAGLYGARGANLAATNEPMPGIVPSGGAAFPVIPPSGSVAPSGGNLGVFGATGGRYPQSDALVQGADPVQQLMAAPPPQRAQLIGRLSPAQRAAIAAQYRAAMMPRARQPAAGSMSSLGQTAPP